MFLICSTSTGKKCILLFTTTAADETSGLLFVTGQEIAFGKKTYATTHNSDRWESSKVIVNLVAIHEPVSTCASRLYILISISKYIKKSIWNIYFIKN